MILNSIHCDLWQCGVEARWGWLAPNTWHITECGVLIVSCDLHTLMLCGTCLNLSAALALHMHAWSSALGDGITNFQQPTTYEQCVNTHIHTCVTDMLSSIQIHIARSLTWGSVLILWQCSTLYIKRQCFSIILKNKPLGQHTTQFNCFTPIFTICRGPIELARW